MDTLADKIIDFNKSLKYEGPLPEGFSVLNPFADNPETLEVMEKFYKKFYNDGEPRKFLIGINPSRHGAGITGVPFTDTKNLAKYCGIEMKSAYSHEVSSMFMYDMIMQFGGVERFYSKYYINSPFPLAIIRQKSAGRFVNANYYDDKILFETLKPFMIEMMQQHFNLGLDRSEVFVLGKKNAVFLQKLNAEADLFEKMTVLEHPRYIQQYKSKEKTLYIDKYLENLWR